MNEISNTTIERFNSKIDKPNFTSCWFWTGARNERGYGRFNSGNKKELGKKYVYAHRFAYFLYFGIAPEMLVLHKCDNPSCVNPDHLFLGTNRENTIDMHAKGRHINQNSKKKFCKNGHEFNQENTRVFFSKKNGKLRRACKICLKNNMRRWLLKK